MFPKTKLVRSESYRRFVASFACFNCGRARRRCDPRRNPVLGKPAMFTPIGPLPAIPIQVPPYIQAANDPRWVS